MTGFSRLIASILAAALLIGSAVAAEPKIEWTPEAVELRELDPKIAKSLATVKDQSLADWQKIFSVYTELPDLAIDPSVPPIAGSYEFRENTLRFKPVFPFEPGVRYRAAFRPHRVPGGSGQILASSFELKRTERPSTTVVTAIYPTAPTIPENILKFYIKFSAPMSGGSIYDHIKLRDTSGKLVELPFLEIDEELWNPDMTRLTLFLDPGRIKRGVKPLEDIGPSFRPGVEYELEIASTWKDANGQPLTKSHVKKFAVSAADRQTPDPQRWKIQPPSTASTNALVVRFDEPLDHAIATRTIKVRNAAGEVILGHAELRAEETEWRYIPEHKWRSGRYVVQVPSLIEDLAGNNIGEAFDVDSSQGVRRRVNQLIDIAFEIL